MKKIILGIILTAFFVGCYYDKSQLLTPVTPPPTASNTFTVTYAISSATITVGTTGNTGTPVIVNTAGGSVTYKLVNAPTGVTVDTSGIVSWAATVVVGTYNFSVIATNIKSLYDTSNFLLQVDAIGAAVVAPSGYSYSPASTTISNGTAGSSLAPLINTGGGTITYSLTSPPAGVTINSSTGVISWASTVAAGTYTINAKATNSAGNATTTYSLTITAGVYTVSFKNDILPVISSQCATCHQSTHPTWTQWSTIYTAATSIYGKLAPVGNMPKGSTLAAVPTSEVSSGLFRDLFYLWITQGKKNN